jgi:alpha-1,3-mannosyltransferase
MLSVVHVCTDFLPSTGGIQQFVHDLAQRSISSGIRVTVLCFNRTKGMNGTLPARETVESIAIRRIPYIDLVYYKPSVIPLSILRSHDVIHVHGVGAQLDFIALTKRLHGRPIVVSTHGGIFHTPNLGILKRIYFDKILPMILQKVDVVAACSRSDESLFRTVSNRVTLLENAVEVEPYLALTGARRQPGRCLYVGRLSDNKGIDLLLHAASVARRQDSEFSLRLVGPDVAGKRGRYERLANTLGIADCVTFVGDVSYQSLLEEFDLAETFVSASQYEGFGLATIEARAAGCRLLLQDNDAFRSLFAADAAATLVDFNNAELAGSVFSCLLRQLPNFANHETRPRTRLYSWDRKIVEWLDLYRQISGCSIKVPKPTGAEPRDTTK